MSGSDTPILIITGAIGFIIGLVVGELFQTVVAQILFPEVTSTIVNACPVEGPWKETQDSVIGTTRVAIDMIAGVSGAVTLLGLMSIFGGRRS